MKIPSGISHLLLPKILIEIGDETNVWYFWHFSSESKEIDSKKYSKNEKKR